jgi:hypothetical protein
MMDGSTFGDNCAASLETARSVTRDSPVYLKLAACQGKKREELRFRTSGGKVYPEKGIGKMCQPLATNCCIEGAAEFYLPCI